MNHKTQTKSRYESSISIALFSNIGNKFSSYRKHLNEIFSYRDNSYLDEVCFPIEVLSHRSSLYKVHSNGDG